jgi:3D (Asp-Asp-Asp) domain-containing protein/peptidoglycan hydrolase CwlO-like protein
VAVGFAFGLTAAIHPATASGATAVGSLSDRHDAALVDLLMARRRLADVERELGAATGQLQEAEAELGRVQALEAAAAEDFAAVNQRFLARARETYKQGRGGWLGILVGSADLSDFLARLDLLGKVLTDESRLLDEVAAKQTSLKSARADLEKVRAERAGVVQRLTDARAELESAERYKNTVAERLGGELRAAERAAQEAETKIAALNKAAVQAETSTTEAGVARRSKDSGRSSRGADGSGIAPSRRTTSSSSPESPESPEPVQSGKQLSVKVTAYCLPGTTASGAPVGRGVIAVDPRVIPLGTRIRVPGYGDGIAADTGGAVKGNVIDVWLPEDEANSWGVKYLTITILG